MAERTQQLQIVREGETVTVTFANSRWKPTVLTVDSFEGIVSVEAVQDGIRVRTALVNLRRI